jgi:hypothetical protein
MVAVEFGKTLLDFKHILSVKLTGFADVLEGPFQWFWIKQLEA